MLERGKGAKREKASSRAPRETLRQDFPQAPFSPAALIDALLSPHVQIAIFSRATALVKDSPMADEVPRGMAGRSRTSKGQAKRRPGRSAPQVAQAKARQEVERQKHVGPAAVLPLPANGSEQQGAVHRACVARDARVARQVDGPRDRALGWTGPARGGEARLAQRRGTRVACAEPFVPPAPSDDVEYWNSAITTDDVDHLLDSHNGADWIVAAGLDPATYASYEVGLRADLADNSGALQPALTFRCRMQPLRDSSPSASARALDASAYAFEAEVESEGCAPPALRRSRRYPLFAISTGVPLRKTRRAATHRACSIPHSIPARWTEGSFQGLSIFSACCATSAPSRPVGQQDIESSRTPVGDSSSRSRATSKGAAGLRREQARRNPASQGVRGATDEFAAINAYLRAPEFFGRLDLYGLPASVHLGFTAMPIAIAIAPASSPAEATDAP